jgi:hypothetical protein
MIIIQGILFFLLLIAIAIYFRYFSHQIIGRIIVLAMGCVLFIFILFPSTSNYVAWSLGIGRGVDLIFELAHAFMLIIVGLLYIKLKEQQSILTELVRKIAIEFSRQKTDGK